MAFGRKSKRPQTEKNRKIKQRKKQWRLQRNERRVARQQQKALDRIVNEIDTLEELENFDRGINNRLLAPAVHSDENEHIEAEENGKFEIIARLDKLENQLVSRRDSLLNNNDMARMTINSRLQAVKRIRAAYDKWSHKQQPLKKSERKLKKRKLQHKKNSDKHIQSNNHASVSNSDNQQLIANIVPNPGRDNAIAVPLPDGNAIDVDIDDHALSKNIFTRWDVPVNWESLQQQLETVFVMLCTDFFKQLQQLNSLSVVDDDQDDHETTLIVKSHTTQGDDDLLDPAYVLQVVDGQEKSSLDSQQQQWQLFHNVYYKLLPMFLLNSFAQYRQNILMSKSLSQSSANDVDLAQLPLSAAEAVVTLVFNMIFEEIAHAGQVSLQHIQRQHILHHFSELFAKQEPAPQQQQWQLFQLFMLTSVAQYEQNKLFLDSLSQLYINSVNLSLLSLSTTEAVMAIVIRLMFEGMQLISLHSRIRFIEEQFYQRDIMLLHYIVLAQRRRELRSNVKKSVKTDDGEETPGNTKKDDDAPGKNKKTDDKFEDRNTIVDDDHQQQGEEGNVGNDNVRRNDRIIDDPNHINHNDVVPLINPPPHDINPQPFMGEMPMDLDNDPADPADDDIAEEQPGLQRVIVNNPIDIHLNDEEDIEGVVVNDASLHKKSKKKDPKLSKQQQKTTGKDGENSSDEEGENEKNDNEIAHTYNIDDNQEEIEYDADDDENEIDDYIARLGSTHQAPNPAAIKIDRNKKEKEEGDIDTLDASYLDIKQEPDPYDADVEDNTKIHLNSTSKIYGLLHKIGDPTKKIKDQFDEKVKIGQTQYFKSPIEPIIEETPGYFDDDIDEEQNSNSYFSP